MKTERVNTWRGVTLAMRIAACLVVFLHIAPVAEATSPEVAEARSLWKARQYDDVVNLLLRYRPEPGGRNFEIDFMIATSYCLTPDYVKQGERYFDWIFARYAVPRKLGPILRSARDDCVKGHLALERGIYQNFEVEGVRIAGGVKGKTYYAVDRRNVLNADDGSLVLQSMSEIPKIPAEELRTRIRPIPEQHIAQAELSSRIQNWRLQSGTPHVMHSSEHFVFASLSRHSNRALISLAGDLERLLKFLQGEFQIDEQKQLLTVYLVPNGESLFEIASKAHGLQIPDGSIGYSVNEDLSIVAIQTGAYPGTLGHELFHLLIREKFGDIPPWLDEGVAALYEVADYSQPKVKGLPNWRGVLLADPLIWQKRPSLGALFTMDWDIFDGRAMDSPVTAPANEATARYFALYMQNTGKLKNIVSRIQKLTPGTVQGGPGERAIAEVEAEFGKNLETIDQEFVSWFFGDSFVRGEHERIIEWRKNPYSR